MKYYFGVGVGFLGVMAVGYLLLFSAGPLAPELAPALMPDEVAAVPNVAEPVQDRSAAPSVPAAPEAVVLQDFAAVPVDQDALLEDMAAETRETLPSSVTDTLSMTDALFLPRMRIMEYTYVTTAADARASARDMRTLIEAGAKRLCLEGREMFGMGVTLRNSFETRDGTLFQRVYLLPEDCQQFY